MINVLSLLPKTPTRDEVVKFVWKTTLRTYFGDLMIKVSLHCEPVSFLRRGQPTGESVYGWGKQ